MDTLLKTLFCICIVFFVVAFSMFCKAQGDSSSLIYGIANILMIISFASLGIYMLILFWMMTPSMPAAYWLMKLEEERKENERKKQKKTKGDQK